MGYRCLLGRWSQQGHQVWQSVWVRVLVEALEQAFQRSPGKIHHNVSNFVSIDVHALHTGLLKLRAH